MKSVSSGHGGDAAPRIPYLLSTRPWPPSSSDGWSTCRFQPARDFACLLDLDADVERWSATPPILMNGDDEYQLDLLVVTYADRFWLMSRRKSSAPVRGTQRS